MTHYILLKKFVWRAVSHYIFPLRFVQIPLSTSMCAAPFFKSWQSVNTDFSMRCPLPCPHVLAIPDSRTCLLTPPYFPMFPPTFKHTCTQTQRVTPKRKPMLRRTTVALVLAASFLGAQAMDLSKPERELSKTNKTKPAAHNNGFKSKAKTAGLRLVRTDFAGDAIEFSPHPTLPVTDFHVCTNART